MKQAVKQIRLADLLYIALLTILLSLKSALFYSGLHLADFEFPLAAATGAIFFTLYLVLSLLSPRLARATLTVLYWIASSFMGIDAVYYAYVSKLPSIALLGMLWQAKGVSATIANLITLSHVAMIFDLPFWALAKIHRDLLWRRLPRTREALEQTIHRGVVYSFVTLPVLAAAVVALWPGFEPEYMVNELFCYHTTDIVNTLRTVGDERGVDKSKYTEPDYSGEDYFGIAEGRNVIILQVEAMQNFVIGASYQGQEITPNLNRLLGADTYYFDNYYYQIGGGNTSDAEFAVNNSLFAPEQDAAYVKYPNNSYHGLPYLLKDNGYSGAHVFHGYIPEYWNREAAYPNQGFDSFTSLEDMEQTEMFEMGLSDKEVFRQSMEQLKTYEEPFYAFYITLSSHYPYALPLDKRWITPSPEDDLTLFGFYLQAMHYTDWAIGEFITMLDEAGLYDNSVIVIYGDHYALTNTDARISGQVSSMLGRPYSVFDVFNVPLLIHIPGMDHAETISVAGGHMDVLPTLLPLLGIRNDKAVMFGQNLLAATEGIVCEQTHMAVGSFISDTVYFKKPHNNIASNYDAYAIGTIERLDPTLFTEISDACAAKIADCAALMAQNDVLLD